MKLRIVVSALLALFCVSSFATSLGNKTIAFKNQRGSKLTLIGHPETKHSGTISGTFTSAVPTQRCRRIVGKTVPVSGFFSGNAVALTVSFPRCGAVLSIVGNFDRSKNFHTMWIDTHQANDPDGRNASARTIGHDLFQAATSAEKPSANRGKSRGQAKWRGSRRDQQAKTQPQKRRRFIL